MDAPEANSRIYEDLALERLRVALRHVSASPPPDAASRLPRRPDAKFAWSVIPGEFMVLIASALVFLGMFYSTNGSLRPLVRTVETLFGAGR